jgi:hypothetical protein
MWAPLPAPHHGEAGTAALLFKLALSNEQCGAIIGRGGRVISSLQHRHGSAIKLSSAQDLVPGTAFRSASVRGMWQAVRGTLHDSIVVLHQVRSAPLDCSAQPWGGLVPCR